MEFSAGKPEQSACKVGQQSQECIYHKTLEVLLKTYTNPTKQPVVKPKYGVLMRSTFAFPTNSNIHPIIMLLPHIQIYL